MKTKKLIKIISLIILSIFIVVIFTGCSQIEDTNGADNFNLQTITDSNIINGMTTMSIGSMETNISNKTTLSINQLSGVRDVLEKSIANQTLKFDINCNVYSGNFRAVIIKDNTIIENIEINKESTITLNNANGKYLIKVAGESAKFELSVTTTIN